jgi:polygalacturonase
MSLRVRMSFFLLVGVLGTVRSAQPTCSVASQPGARGDNRTLNTAAFRAAAAACCGLGRRGARSVVLVPAGVWLTGAFNLSSFMELRLERGATITAVMTEERREYPALPPFPSYGACRETGNDIQPPAGYTTRSQALISAFSADDVAIIGAGSQHVSASVIDGQGCWWWKRYLEHDLKRCRPQLINFISSTQIEVRGVTLRNPAYWNLHLFNSTGAHIHDGRSESIKQGAAVPCAAASEHVFAVNSDGIDIDSSSDVLVEKMFIAADDDAVAIKSGMQAAGEQFGVPSRNVTVRDSILLAHGFAVGSECSGGCEDIVLQHSVVSDMNGSSPFLLIIKSAPGRRGYIRNVLLQNVTGGRMADPDKPSDGIGFRFDLESSGTITENITLQDVHIAATSGLAGRLYGDSITGGVKGLLLNNVTVAESQGGWVCKNVHPVFQNVTPAPDIQGGCLQPDRE